MEGFSHKEGKKRGGGGREKKVHNIPEVVIYRFTGIALAKRVRYDELVFKTEQL